MITIKKSDIEKLFDIKKYDYIKLILKKCDYTDEEINGLFSSLDVTDPRLYEKSRKYIINKTMQEIRTKNDEKSYESFTPFKISKKIFKTGLKKYITKEEKDYIRHLNRKDISNLNNIVDEKTYYELLNIYNYKKEDSYIGIHRTSADVSPIFEEGIKFTSKAIDIHDTVQIMRSFPKMLTAISACEHYKGSFGCFIIKIPKDAIDKSNIPIYYKKDDSFYLNPKYVVGYVPVKNKKLLYYEPNSEAKRIESDYYNGDYLKIDNEKTRELDEQINEWIKQNKHNKLK